MLAVTIFEMIILEKVLKKICYVILTLIDPRPALISVHWATNCATNEGVF